MKKATIFAMIVLFLLAISAVAFAEDMHDQHMKKGEKSDAPKVFDSQQDVGTKAACPVTGKTFTITKDTLHSEYKGKHVYFCCAGCKPQFDKDPKKFLKEK